MYILLYILYYIIRAHARDNKKNPKQFYEYNKEYDVNAETGKRLIESGKFKEIKIEDKPKKNENVK